MAGSDDTGQVLWLCGCDFKPETLEGNEKMKYALADLQTNFDELNLKISKKNKDIEKGRFSLGDKVLLENFTKSHSQSSQILSKTPKKLQRF